MGLRINTPRASTPSTVRLCHQRVEKKEGQSVSGMGRGWHARAPNGFACQHSRMVANTSVADAIDSSAGFGSEPATVSTMSRRSGRRLGPCFASAARNAESFWRDLSSSTAKRLDSSAWSFLRAALHFFLLSCAERAAGVEMERRVAVELLTSRRALDSASGVSAAAADCPAAPPLRTCRLRASCAAIKFLRASPSLMVGT